jgi:hypothetical protein
MSSAPSLALVLLLSSFAVAQNQAVPHSGPPMPQADASFFAHPDPLAGTTLPLDSQRALLAPKTPFNLFAQSPDSSQGFALNQASLEEVARYFASHGFDPAQFTARVSPQGQISWERYRVCLSIRTYLMARDSKDSDSTHLVSTSTCQPAQQYGLKTTDLKMHALQP